MVNMVNICKRFYALICFAFCCCHLVFEIAPNHAKTLCVLEPWPAACACQMQTFALEHVAIPGSRLPKYCEEVLPTALPGLRTAHETLADVVKVIVGLPGSTRNESEGANESATQLC